MKRLNPILLVIGAMTLLAFGGCTGDQGEQGPAGPAGTATCLQACHTDDYQMQQYIVDIQNEYASSQHALGTTDVRRSAPCSGCHTTEGYQYRVANNGDTVDLEESSHIGCFGCHAPHTNGDFSLRKTGPTDLEMGGAGAYDKGNSNTCAMCHQARAPEPAIDSTDAITSTRWGPHHGPQANVLSGNGAYVFAGASYGVNHAHNTGNPDGCVTCHMAPPPADGMAGGHSWWMTYEYHSAEELNSNGCVLCHGTQTDMLALVEDSQAAFATDLETLATGMETLGWLNAGHDAVVAAGVGTDANARGAVWNYLLLLDDTTMGVHNPTYARAVLTATQSYVTSQLQLMQ
jgi:hypothetical protein